MYMGAAENEVIKFHNPPQMTPAIFETYLPYAMVLGVDKIWGKNSGYAGADVCRLYQ